MSKVEYWHSFEWKPKEDGIYVVGNDTFNFLGLFLNGKWVKSLNPEEELDTYGLGCWGISKKSKEMNELRNKIPTRYRR
jgi:hypothetical protein